MFIARFVFIRFAFGEQNVLNLDIQLPLQLFELGKESSGNDRSRAFDRLLVRRDLDSWPIRLPVESG